MKINYVRLEKQSKYQSRNLLKIFKNCLDIPLYNASEKLVIPHLNMINNAINIPPIGSIYFEER